MCPEWTPQTSTTSAGDTIDSFVIQQMDEAGIVGLGAAIIVDREVVWMKGSLRR